MYYLMLKLNKCYVMLCLVYIIYILDISLKFQDELKYVDRTHKTVLENEIAKEDKLINMK